MSKKPSSEYDPMSYGEIRLESADGTGKPGDNPDEILFDDTPPAEPSTTFGDVANAFTDGDSESWNLMEGDIKEYMPSGRADGGEEVYSGSPLMTGPDDQKARPPATPAAEPSGSAARDSVQDEMAAQASQAGSTSRRDTAETRSRKRPSSSRSMRAVTPARLRMPPMPSRGRRLSLPVAFVILAAGLGGGAYFHFQLDNPVLGAVSAAMGLVGSLFALILLRR